MNIRSGLRAMGALRQDGLLAEEPVALETAVVATGARPGNASKRELFTEETQTVLVFERGAVIRLSAAVTDGQLLFLTNKKTGKEVVTQVVRKRSFRPTSSYIDLEFTEESPGFWGIEFPKSAPAIPSADVVAAEGEKQDSPKHAAPADLQEVERLKKEVSELQTQLKALAGQAAEPIAAPETVESTKSDGSENASSSELIKKQQEEDTLAILLAQEAEQEKLLGPRRQVAYPKKGVSSVVESAGKVATAAAFAAVIVAAVIAVYRFGLLDSWFGKSAAAKAAPVKSAVNLKPSAPPQTQPASPATFAASSTAANSSETRGTAAPIAKPAEPPITASDGSPPAVKNSAPTDDEPAKAASADSKEGKRSDSPLASSSAGLSAAGGLTNNNSAASTTESVAASADDFTPPKLVHSVKPVSPPEALRNYITGNVTVDALVDATGHVKSVTVISGPQKLRNPAIEEMKRYLYEPARKNGKPVASHVQQSLQYWYEP